MKRKAKPQNAVLTIQEYTASQEIAELQLNRLRDIARERLMTYEETKVFDLLTKNLLLAKGEATGIIDTTSMQQQLPEAEEKDLLKIAQFVEPEKISDILNFVEDAKDGSNQDPTNES